MPLLLSLFARCRSAHPRWRPERTVHWLGYLVVAVSLAPSLAEADEPAGATDLTAVRAAAEAYRNALTTGDADAIRDAWTTDGDIIDGWGNRFEAGSAGLFVPGPGPRPEFRVGESRLRMIAPDVVVEDGTVDVVLPGMTMPLEGWFSAIWVRRGDSWKLAGVRESERPAVAGAEMLDDLAWMVGDWTLEVEAADKAAPKMTMSVRWDAGRSFLIRDARVPVTSAAAKDERVIEIHQWIGWDPLVRRIRSWSFSSDGSRGEATWFRDGDSWVSERTVVLPNGSKETMTSIYSFDGQDRCVWRILPEGIESDDGRPTKAVWVRTLKGTEK